MRKLLVMTILAATALSLSGCQGTMDYFRNKFRGCGRRGAPCGTQAPVIMQRPQFMQDGVIVEGDPGGCASGNCGTPTMIAPGTMLAPGETLPPGTIIEGAPADSSPSLPEPEPAQ